MIKLTTVTNADGVHYYYPKTPAPYTSVTFTGHNSVCELTCSCTIPNHTDVKGHIAVAATDVDVIWSGAGSLYDVDEVYINVVNSTAHVVLTILESESTHTYSADISISPTFTYRRFTEVE